MSATKDQQEDTNRNKERETDSADSVDLKHLLNSWSPFKEYHNRYFMNHCKILKQMANRKKECEKTGREEKEQKGFEEV